MSAINGVGGGLPVQPQTGSLKVGGTAVPATRSSRSDSVELSGGVAEYLKILQSNDVRSDKVASVRAAIESGTYDDDFKLNVAVDRLLDDLNA